MRPWKQEHLIMIIQVLTRTSAALTILKMTVNVNFLVVWPLWWRARCPHPGWAQHQWGWCRRAGNDCLSPGRICKTETHKQNVIGCEKTVNSFTMQLTNSNNQCINKNNMSTWKVHTVCLTSRATSVLTPVCATELFHLAAFTAAYKSNIHADIIPMTAEIQHFTAELKLQIEIYKQQSVFPSLLSPAAPAFWHVSMQISLYHKC